MSDKAFGWIVTATARHSGGEPLAKVWYTACPEMAAAIESVRRATNDPAATFEISRELSETLMLAFGLQSGEARCFD